MDSMSNLLERIKNSLSADFHEVLDQKEGKNPIVLLNQYLRQSEQEVEKVRKLVERQHQLKDEFTREYRQAVNIAEKRKRQAEITAKAEENELHQFVVQEQAQYEARAARLKESLQKLSQQLLELEQKHEEMKHKLKDMYIKRMELMGRENIARAFHKVNQVLDSDKLTDNAFSRFGEIEGFFDRIEQNVNSSYHRNTVDARIAQLEKEIQKAEENQSV